MSKKILIVLNTVLASIKARLSKAVIPSVAKTKHLIVISVDALNAKDYPIIIKLPNFRKLLNQGSYAKEVIGVYPSLTYPSHTSIITGTYPCKHGIYANEISHPGVKIQKWYWYRNAIKVPTLYDIAKKSNMKVGAISWPVMAGAKIDYNLPEIWSVDKSISQSLLYLKTGTPLAILDVYLKYRKILNGAKQPNLDNFITTAAAHLIKKHKPNLFLLHLTELDHARHKHGIMSTNAIDALKKEDSRIGQIIQATKDASIYEDTTFIVLGDHGFSDVAYKICLNVAFRKSGLLDVDINGKVTSWKVYANSTDGSCQIVLKDKNDVNVKNKVKVILYALLADKTSGIKKIFSKEAARIQKKVCGNFEFMLETKDGYFFTNDWTPEYMVNKIYSANFDEYNEEYYVATHGYDPLKSNYRTFFMAAGKGIKKGIVIPSINIVDEGPTMASLLGIKMHNVDGKVLTNILD